MAVPYKLPRGTRSALNTLASSAGLLPYQVYWLTDEDRAVVATSTTAYAELGKRIHVGTTPPTDTSLVWIDTN